MKKDKEERKKKTEKKKEEKRKKQAEENKILEEYQSKYIIRGSSYGDSRRGRGFEVLNTTMKEGAMVGNGAEDTVAVDTQVAMATEEAVGMAMVAIAAMAEEVLVASMFLEEAKVNVAVAEVVVATKVAAFELSLDNLCSAFDARTFCT